LWTVRVKGGVYVVQDHARVVLQRT
jgi:hypothetical protein